MCGHLIFTLHQNGKTHSNADHLTTRLWKNNSASGYDPKISDEGQTVGVVDERSEIGACYQGVAQNDLGIQTDVMDACEKGQGMNMLIRSMAPDVIAVDEIGSKEDVEALFFCAYRGCSILATVHGKNKESLSKNPYMREIINKKMFQRYVILEQRNQPGYIAQIMDENGVVLN